MLKTNQKVVVLKMELNDVLESKPLAKNIFLYFGSKCPAPVQVFLNKQRKEPDVLVSVGTDACESFAVG